MEFDWFGVVNGCFEVVLGWCWWYMGGVGVVSGLFECNGLLRFGRWWFGWRWGCYVW